MSYSYTNLQVRTADADAVRRAIDLCDVGSAKLLARAEVPWIGIYPFMTEGDFPYLKEVAQKISAQMELPVFGFMVPQGDFFYYVLCDGGKVVDEHRIDDDAEQHQQGNAEIILQHCIKEATLVEVEAALQMPAPRDSQAVLVSGAGQGDKSASRLASLLGIPRAQLCTGYNHLKWAQAGR